jgi:predicted dehydrogenase
MNRSILIGCGSVGKKHLNLLSRVSHEVLVIDPKEPDLTGIKGNVSWFPTLDDVVPEKFDLIVIATWSDSHLELFEKTLRFSPTGVLVEKPLSNSVASCERIKQLATENDIQIRCNFTRANCNLTDEIQAFFYLQSDQLRRIEWRSDDSACLMTTGLHWLNLAENLFQGEAVSCTGKLTLSNNNPRSNHLKFLHGELMFDFTQKRCLYMNTTSTKDNAIYLYGENTKLKLLGNKLYMYADEKWTETLNLSFDFNTALMQTYHDLITKRNIMNYNLETSKNFIELVLPIMRYKDGNVTDIENVEVPLS